MIRLRTPRPAVRAAAVAATVAALTLALVAGPGAARPAAAHGGDGTMALVSATRAGPGDDVSLLVRLTYVEDGHGVPDATVTAVVDGATPVPLTAGAEEGDYGGIVAAAPGTTIRVTSVEPATTLDVDAPPATETPTTAADTTTTEAPAPTGSDPTTTSAPAPGDGAATVVDDEDDDGNGLLVVGGLVAAALVVGAVAFLVARRGGSDDDGPGAGGGDDGPAAA